MRVSAESDGQRVVGDEVAGVVRRVVLITEAAPAVLIDVGLDGGGAVVADGRVLAGDFGGCGAVQACVVLPLVLGASGGLAALWTAGEGAAAPGALGHG